MARCPAHKDHDPSLSIGIGEDGRILLKCFAGCALPDILRKKNLVIADLFDSTLRDGAEAARQAHNLKAVGSNPTPANGSFDWGACVEALSEKALQSLAKARGFSLEFAAEMKASRLIGLHEGHFCVPVYEQGKVVGVQYRIKEDHSWRYSEGATLIPWVIGPIEPADPIEIFESNLDALAFMFCSGYRSNIISTRGTGGAKLAAASVPKGATARLWTQRDSPGEQWEADFCAAYEGTVVRVTIPIVYKDLNQWIQEGATFGELAAAITKAQTIKEGEQSWIQILKKGRVTSMELDDLALTPRPKVLGNWMCEGDEGIVYAPRGDGKTWFAIGVSIAISTAGKFGEFVAPRAVPVLYVDGEMPADLLRERTRGLLKNNHNLHIINHEILFDRTNRVINLNNLQAQDALLEMCIQDQIKVLVLDNGSTLFSGLKENEADSWHPIQRWLLNFRRHHIAVILVLHAGRNGLIRGTSSREDPVSWIISITKSELSEVDKGCRFITRFTKQSRNTGGEQVPDYEWFFTMDEYGSITTECKIADSLAVFHAIIESGVNECNQIARLMNVETYTISRLAKKAIEQGWLEKRGKEYRLKGADFKADE